MRLLLALAFVAGLAGASSRLHPEIVLLDAQGENVLESGAPVSPERTCGECHDTQYIASHSYHSAVGLDELREGPGRDFGPGMFGRWNPVVYRRLSRPGEAEPDLDLAGWIRLFGARHVGGGPARGPSDATKAVAPGDWDWEASGGVEMNCFLCHIEKPANDRRIVALEAGRFRWAATATLAGTGLVEPAGEGSWRYRRAAFTADGAVAQETIRIGDPRSTSCGLCHTNVFQGAEPVELSCDTVHWDTDCTGQVFSPQMVSDSALNLRDKESLARPWDVHAERLLECTACHHSLNNPVRFTEAERSRPRHLAYDARRLEIGDYLEKPSHHFTKGESAQGHVARRLDGSMRRCEGCHDAQAAHEDWLPNTRRHLQTLLCESCHVPSVPAPARQQTDWTVLLPGGRPHVDYRGVEGSPRDPASLVTGYEPVILPRHQRDGRIRHGPHNLSTTWFWASGEPSRPVRIEDLERAWFDSSGAYRPELVAILDEDGDGEIESAELRLDTEDKVDAVRDRLAAAGVANARVEGLIQPASLHHGVVAGEFATRRCETCHARDSRMTRPFLLSSFVPAGAEARLAGDTNIRLPGRMYVGEAGALLYEPVPTASGRYVIGHDRAGWIDWIGILLVLATLVGAGAHAAGRFLLGRKGS